MIQVQKNNTSLSPEAFLSLIKAVGWSDETVMKLDGLQLAIHSCSASYSIWQHGKLVALGRVLSDNYIFSCIPEVLVHPKFQKSGYGKAIMEHIIEDYGHTIIFLGAQAGNEGFFEKLGFKKGPQSYERLFKPPKKKTN